MNRLFFKNFLFHESIIILDCVKMQTYRKKKLEWSSEFLSTQNTCLIKYLNTKSIKRIYQSEKIPLPLLTSKEKEIKLLFYSILLKVTKIRSSTENRKSNTSFDWKYPHSVNLWQISCCHRYKLKKTFKKRNSVLFLCLFYFYEQRKVHYIACDLF